MQQTPVRASTSCYGRFTLHMDSSSGFGSTPSNIGALFTLAFALAPSVTDLTTLLRVTRRIILQKARRQAVRRPRPPTAWKQTVSGSISLPSPGCFSPFPHGTVHYRSQRVVRLGEWAPQLHAGLHVSGATQEQVHAGWRFPYPAVTVYGGAFQTPSGSPSSYVWVSVATRHLSYNPAIATPTSLAR